MQESFANHMITRSSRIEQRPLAILAYDKMVELSARGPSMDFTVLAFNGCQNNAVPPVPSHVRRHIHISSLPPDDPGTSPDNRN